MANGLIKDDRGRIIMPFGDHKGEFLDDVPDWYLKGLVSNCSWFPEQWPDLYEVVIEKLGL